MLLLTILTTIAAGPMFASSALANETTDRLLSADEQQDYLQADPEDLAWWREARFGLFVHWGPVSLKGTEIGWSRGGERRGRGGRGNVPAEEYDNLYTRFNPVEFNAEEWVKLARQAGMKYLVFTTKHHDGFSMFDSKLTDYKITNSPFGRDVVEELARACHAGGIRLGFYYSPPDWYHPDYRTDRHDKYIEFLHGQLRELCTNYGRVDIIWFDGLGGKAADWDSPRLFKIIRSLQPDVLINRRAGLPGDFDTPEQQVGRFQIDRPWESCITICNQWAYRPNDRMKSLEECVEILVRCAGGDGNLLLNVGPMPNGEIEPRQAERLREIGTWLRRHGAGIYGTRGGPYRPTAWCASTRRGTLVYVHVLRLPDGARRSGELELPGLPYKVRSARLLTSNEALPMAQTEKAILVKLAETQLEPMDTIIVLELEDSAMDLAPIAIPSGSVATGKVAKASNVFQKQDAYGASQAFDDDDTTRWATDAGTKQAWLEVDLGEPMRIGAVRISEAFHRVRGFALQRWTGQAWETFASGGRLGDGFAMEFDPVTATRVRLNLTDAVEGPTIWEFQLFRAAD